MRLIDFFDRGAAHFPDRDCLIDGESRKTFRQVADSSRRIAAALRARGAGVGSKVAVLSPNSALAFECILGILRLGSVWVPLNARNLLDDHVHLLGVAECEWLFYHREFEPMIAPLRERVPTLRHCVRMDAAADPVAASGPLPDVPDDPQALCLVFASGGTTGRSKGVMWTNLMMETLVANFCAAIDYYDEPPTHLVAAPITHAAGVVSFPLMAFGATTVILPTFDALDVMRAIQEHEVSILYLPPTAIYLMLAHPQLRDFDFSSLRHFVYAAAPMSVDKLVEAMDVFGPVMLQTYGQAEAPMVCTILTRRDHVEALRSGNTGRLASCGRPSMSTRVAIVNDDGTFLQAGERGEIVVRGNLVMPGYYNDPAATAQTLRGGWLHTGDIGYLDAEGYCYIVDRKKDMIITGGFNVYPSEVEQVLWSHPAVQDCAVIGIPDPKWGEAVTAVVELKPGASATTQELHDYCRPRLGGVKTPKTFDIRAALPRSPNGKVLKRAIRDSYWTGKERKI